MANFQNFFHKKEFHLSAQEKVNLSALSGIAKAKNGRISMVTTAQGVRGLAVVREAALESNEIVRKDVISNVMTGRNKRIKEIYKWLGTVNLDDHIKPRTPPKKPIIKAVKEFITGEES